MPFRISRRAKRSSLKVQGGSYWDEVKPQSNKAEDKTCYCCRILHDGCAGSMVQHGLSEANVEDFDMLFHYDIPDSSQEYDVDCQKLLTLRFKGGHSFKVEAFTLSETNCPCPDSWDDIPSSQRLSPHTNSEEALEKLKSWLTICDNEHEFCNARELHQLPKRVVDVGLKDNTIRLVDTDGEKALYLSLSHCWGLSPIITTTKSTLELRKGGIPEEQLSNTFREAIYLSRKLNIQYLWIDSLCIVQDDALDWQEESAKMASIYRDSYLTIAATKSKDGNGGLFTPTPDFEMAGATPEGEDYRLFFRRQTEHVPTHEDLNANSPPLFSRGWCFQERLISLRIVHYGADELSFECQTESFCECDQIYGSEIPLAQPKLAYAQSLDADATLYYRQLAWRALVMQYSALSLTKENDCFPALGGVASQMSEVRDSRYLAGLWEDSIYDDMLWQAHGWSVPRPSVWRAPSWSWASTKSAIYYEDAPLHWDPDEGTDIRDEGGNESLSTVLSCHSVLAGANEFGQLKSGMLQISGRCLEAILSYDPVKGIGSYNSHRLNKQETRPVEGGHICYDVILQDRNKWQIMPDYDLSHEGEHLIPPGTPVLLLQLGWAKQDQKRNLVSLVLHKTASEPEELLRLGLLLLKEGRHDTTVYQNAETRVVSIV